MAWHVAVCTWLAQAALGGSVLLIVGCVAAQLCKQPVRRLRVIELTLLGCLLVPWLSRLQFVPHWSAGLLGTPPPPAVEAPTMPSDGPAGIPEARLLAGPPSGPPAADTPPEPPTSSLESAGPEACTAGLVFNPSGQIEHRSDPSVWPPLSLIVVMAYAAATAVLAARWLVGAGRLRSLRRGAVSVPPHVASLFAEVAGPGVRRIELRMSDRLGLPLTCGLRRPVILLPAGMCGDADSAGLRYVLAHEWSHIERRDLFRWHLAGLAGLLFFWQPLFWWLRRQLRLGQDYLADALAARQAGGPTDYAAYLVGLAKCSVELPGECALGIGDRRSNLYRRVLMLVNNREPLQRRCSGLWSVAALAVTVVVAGAVSAVRLDAGDAAAPEKDAPKKEAPKDAGHAAGDKLDYSGTVTDKDTGKPIVDAVVTVRRSLYGDPEVKPEDWIIEETKHKTDKDGKYRFTIPPEQSAKRYLYIELDVEAQGYAPQKGFGYALSMILKNEKIGGRPFFEDVTLRAGKEITGIIQTPDGKPAAGVKVLAYSVTDKRSQGEFEYGSFADTKTDANGKFALTVVTPGPCAFWILPTKYAPSSHAVKDNKRGDLGTFGLTEGIVLKGKAVDAQGKPLAGMFVGAQREDRDDVLGGLPVADSIVRCSPTDDKGEFELMPLPPGMYRVQPSEYNSEPSRDGRGSTNRTLPAVFLPQKVKLVAGQKPDPLEVRAVPHVVIEAQYYDSKGKMRRGHAPFVFGQIDGQSWFTEAKADADGKVTVLAPHGLEYAKLQLSTNEHSALRWRKEKGGALSRAREIDLGTLDKDVKGIEIVRYEAPILLVKVTTKAGAKPKDAGVTAVYPEEKGLTEGRFIVKGGRNSDVTFEEQEDGRFRSEQVLPDEEVTVTAHATGYKDGTTKVKLAEGTTKDVEIVLEEKE
jgi:beta-lactamase regulating signal transducer with metallopeptidase domain